MNDYMRALHQRFFQEPECADMRREIEGSVGSCGNRWTGRPVRSC